MNSLFEAFAHWLADYYLLSSVLLAFALAALFMLRQPARRRAVTQSTLAALAALALLCALPGWSLVHLLTADQLSEPQPNRSRAVQTPAEYQVLSTSPTPTDDFQMDPFISRASRASTDAAVPHRPSIGWKTAFALAHTLGAICVVVWLALGSIAARRLRRGAKAVPAELTSLMQEIAGATQCSASQVELLTSPRIDVAVALGIWRPVVLLPTKWIATRFRDELRTVLAHEAAHLRNRDLHWLAVSRGLTVLLWAQPLFWLVRRRMRLDQEALADAAAAELTSRHRYAEQLVAWARDVAARPPLRLSSAVGLWESPSQLRARIALLIDDRFTVLRRCSRRYGAGAAILTIVAAVALSTVSIEPRRRAYGQQTTQAADKVESSEPATANGAGSHQRHWPEPNTIAGRALDENGQPIGGAEVFLFRINRHDSARKRLADATTGVNGRFQFDDVIDIAREFPDGTFPPLYEPRDEFLQVAVRALGRATFAWLQVPQHVAQFGEYQEIKLLPAATLRGRVTGPDAMPVAGALVSLSSGSFDCWDGARSDRTDDQGNYEISDVASFDMQQYREQQAEQRRRWQVRSSATAADGLFISPPVLVVEHPDFALKKSDFEKIPGTKNLQLDPPAILEGRVVYGDSRQPAAEAPVHVATSLPNDRWPTLELIYTHHRATVLTDADGNYRFPKLPAGTYDVWAESPDWVNEGVNKVTATAEKSTTLPDLTLTKGGVVSVRLLDAETREPLKLPPDARVQIYAHPFQLQATSRPAFQPYAAANSQGRFEVNTLPGQNRISLGGVSVGSGATKWLGEQPTEVEVVDGETITVDVPVVDAKKAQVNAAVFTAANPSPLSGHNVRQKPREAAEALTQVLKERPNDIDALIPRAQAWQLLGEYDKAVADYERVIGMHPTGFKNVIAHNNLAYLLSAAPDDSIRNGKRAVELAEKARQIQPQPSPDVLDTLAAAYAEAGDFDKAVITQREAIEMRPEDQSFRSHLELYQAKQPLREMRPATHQPSNEEQGAANKPVKVRLVQNTAPASGRSADRPPALLSYGDGKADGKKSYGGSGHFIRFELPEGITKIRGIRIHCSRYGYPQAPDEDAEITFLSGDRDETLHTEPAPYRMFKRGKENWVRIMFDKEVELPKKLWIALNFNAEQTKGVYVSYDTSTKGEYSRAGLPGDEEQPKETDFGGDWMVQLMLARPK